MASKTKVDTALPIEFSEVCEVVWEDETASTNGRSLNGAFSQAIVQGGDFDPLYVGSKDRLQNFRGYTVLARMEVKKQSSTYIRSVNIPNYSEGWTDVALSTDGTKMLCMTAGSHIEAYNLSTPFNITTASFWYAYDFSTTTANRMSMAFSPDGMKFYAILDSSSSGNWNKQWNLTAPYTINAGMVYIGQKDAEDGNPYGLNMLPNGESYWVTGKKDGNIAYFTMSTPWDILSAAYEYEFNLSTSTDVLEFMEWVNDGYSLFYYNGVYKGFIQCEVSTPFDIRTRTSVQTGAIIPQDNNGSFYIPNTGSILLVNNTNNRIEEWTYI